MFMPQVDWLSDDEGEIAINHIARFENLDWEFKRLCLRLGITANLPHVKSSNRGDYREYYDEESMEVVSDWFTQDIKLFGYSFE